MGTRGGAALSNTSFSRNPGSAGKSCKSGKINKTLQTKIFKGLKENNIRHLLHCHASLSEAEELTRMNRITSITFCFLEQRPTQPVATCAHVQGAACTGLPSEHPSEALNLLTKPLNKAHGPLSQTALQQDQSWLLNQKSRSIKLQEKAALASLAQVNKTCRPYFMWEPPDLTWGRGVRYQPAAGQSSQLCQSHIVIPWKTPPTARGPAN